MHFFIDFGEHWTLRVEYSEADLEQNRAQIPGKSRKSLPKITMMKWLKRTSGRKNLSAQVARPDSLIELEKFLSVGKGDVAFLANEISPSHLQGQTKFFSRVYAELCKVPRGQVITYRELAKRAGNVKASRAVGQAMAKNPFPLIVPCHRVLRADLKLGNYSAPEGARLKQELLKLEGVVCDLV